LIRSIRHKGLRQLFETGSKRGIPQQLVHRLVLQLDVLNRAKELRDISLPGFHLHQLKGDRKDSWAIKVTANWRLVFQFRDENVHDVDFEDYH